MARTRDQIKSSLIKLQEDNEIQFAPSKLTKVRNFYRIKLLQNKAAVVTSQKAVEGSATDVPTSSAPVQSNQGLHFKIELNQDSIHNAFFNDNKVVTAETYSRLR